MVLGNRKSSGHSLANRNQEWAILTGKASPFGSDMGNRFRVQCMNAESLLVHQEEVAKIVNVGDNEHVKAIKKIMDDKDNYDETVVQASIPMLLYRLCLDEIHQAFSSTANYGLVKAKLNTAKNSLDEVVEKVNLS